LRECCSNLEQTRDHNEQYRSKSPLM
jgi:hypothetical protein